MTDKKLALSQHFGEATQRIHVEVIGIKICQTTESAQKRKSLKIYKASAMENNPVQYLLIHGG